MNEDEQQLAPEPIKVMIRPSGLRVLPMPDGSRVVEVFHVAGLSITIPLEEDAADQLGKALLAKRVAPASPEELARLGDLRRS